MREIFKKSRFVKAAFSAAALSFVVFLGSPSFLGFAQVAPIVQVPLAATSIPKFVDPLPNLDVILAGTSEIRLEMREFLAQPLPTGTFVKGVAPNTTVWGYLTPGQTSRPSHLGPIIVAQRGVPTTIRFVNNLGNVATSPLLAYKQSTDQTLHWADPLYGEMNSGNMTIVPGAPPQAPWNLNYSGPIPAAVHLHGGEVPPELDGGPDSWFLSGPPDSAAFPDAMIQGHGYYSSLAAAANETVYTYPNTQEASPIWFHDHTLGATRLNVYAGLAGGYVLYDPALTLPAGLHPLGLQQGTDATTAEVLTPLIIQDRMFDTQGRLFFPNIGHQS